MRSRYAATLAALLNTLAAVAETPDTSAWRCELCPPNKDTHTNLSAGVLHVDDDAPYFVRSSGVDEAGTFPTISGDGERAGEVWSLGWRADRLGTDAASGAIRVRDGARWRFNGDFVDWPQRRFKRALTPFVDAAAGSLALPDDWVRGPSTADMTVLDASLQQRIPVSDRRRVRAGLSFIATPRWAFDVGVRHDRNRGEAIGGGASFTSAAQLPLPLDSDSLSWSLAANYRAPGTSLRISYRDRRFDNRYPALVWDQPFSGFPGAERFRSARAPDNAEQRLGVRLLSSFGRRLKLSGSIGLSRSRQDDALLAYTVNPLIAVNPLPRGRADATVWHNHAAVAGEYRHSRGPRLRIAYRWRERRNDTPLDIWVPVLVDSLDSGRRSGNEPYDYTRHELSVTALARRGPLLAFETGVKGTRVERSRREVDEQTEAEAWTRLRITPDGPFTAALKIGSAERRFDRYDLDTAAAAGQNPLLRKYDLAHRLRHYGELSLDLAWAEGAVTGGVTIVFSDDDYSRSQLGLTDSDMLGVDADLSWQAGADVGLTVRAGLDRYEGAQATATGPGGGTADGHIG
ncbi:MAG: MtrB/PioB family outer membrane beta-barrel protein, partial [Pseudomonadota bacterium]